MTKGTSILLAPLLILIICQFCTTIGKQPPPTFRITKVSCEVFNKSWVRINLCECRPIRRGFSVFNLNLTVLKPAYNIYTNARVAKKDGWYKPFLYNITFDACDYVKKRNNPLLNIFYNQFRNLSSINHTCPYDGEQIIKGLYVDLNMLKNIPVSNGDYALFITWVLHGSKAFSTNVFAEFNKYDSII